MMRPTPPGTRQTGELVYRDRRSLPKLTKLQEDKSASQSFHGTLHTSASLDSWVFQEPPPSCTSVRMEPFVLLALSPGFTVFSRPHVVFLECRKGHFGGRKGQALTLGSKTQKQPRCLQNKRKHNKTTIGLTTGLGLNLDEQPPL